MDDIRKRSWLNLIIVVAIVVIFTIYKLQSGTDVTSSIGVDDEKVGVVYDDTTAFIMLADIEDVEYIEDLEEITGDYTFIGNSDLNAYILIETDTETYVINGGTQAQTWAGYKDIMEKL